MGLKTAAEYRASLNDGRVIYWGGEKITDVTSHPRFQVPLEVACSDYAYDDPDIRDLITYETEDGTLAHRVYQVPRTVEELHKRLALGRQMSIVGGVTGVYMALLQIKDRLALATRQFVPDPARSHSWPPVTRQSLPTQPKRSSCTKRSLASVRRS